MKRTLVLTVIAFFSLSVIAQNNAIEKYFLEYLENPAFEKFEVTEKTFELLAEVDTDDPEEIEVLEALADIEGVKVIANKETSISSEYYQEAMDKLIPDADYEDLVVLENAANNARFLIRETEESIQEFVAVVGTEEEFVIASLYGEIDVANLSKILKLMKNGGGDWIGGFHHLHNEEIVVKKDTKEKTKTTTNINNIQLSIYPNPATDFINIEPSEGKTAEMSIGFYSLLGKEIEDLGKVNLPYKVNLKQLPAGTYFLRITDTTGDFKNFKIVKPSR